jgi:glycosyltransferase involved in cell wall biosynthesis
MRLKLAASEGVAVVTGPSRYVIDRHLRAGAFPGARCEVVRNAAAPEGVAELFADSPPNDAPPQGLFLGQLGAHKGIPQLVAALRSLWADPACELRFAFAGAGPLELLVQELSAEQPARCRFHGRVAGAAKEALFAACDFLVIPSQWHDVAPQVIQEAAARGRPAIGASLGGIPELIADGKTGLIVAPEPEPLAGAIATYSRDAALRRRHGAAAREAARALTAARQAGSFLRIYEELAARSRPCA